MTGTDNTGINPAAQHKKKAYFAMCKVTVLLFIFTVLSSLASVLISEMLTLLSEPLEFLLAKLLMLFGMRKTTSICVAIEFFSSAAFYESISMLASVITMIIPTLVFVKLTKMTSEECFEVRGKTVKCLPLIFCVCQLLTMSALVFSQTVYGFFVPDGMGGASTGLGGELDTAGIIMRVINVCIFVPVAEEFVFRGVMFSYLKKYGLSFAVVASAMLFGVAHSSPVQTVYAFVFGVLAAFLACVTGNIKTGIVLHALNNFVTVMTEYLGTKTDASTFNSIYAAYTCIVLMASFFGIYRMVVSDDLFEKYRICAKRNDLCIEEHPGLGQIMTIPMIFFVVNYAMNTAMGVLLQ